MPLSEFALGFSVAVLIDLTLFLWIRRTIRRRHRNSSVEQLRQDEFRSKLLVRSLWIVTLMVVLFFALAYPKIVSVPGLAGVAVFVIVLCAGSRSAAAEIIISARARLNESSGSAIKDE